MSVASTTLPSLCKVRFFISILLLIFMTSVGAVVHLLLPLRLLRHTFRLSVHCTVDPSSRRFASRHLSIHPLTPLCFHVLFTSLFTFTFHFYFVFLLTRSHHKHLFCKNTQLGCYVIPLLPAEMRPNTVLKGKTNASSLSPVLALYPLSA